MPTPLPGTLPPPPSHGPARPCPPPISDEEIRLRVIERVGVHDLPFEQFRRVVDALVRYVKTGSWEDPAMQRVDAEAD